MSTRREHLALQRDVALVDLVDQLLAVGVVLRGDVTLSLADVDLLYLQLQVLITPAAGVDLPPVPGACGPVPHRRADTLLTTPRPIPANPDNVERGLVQLVLTIVELLRQLMERQVLRRVEAGGLDDGTVERLGSTLMALADRMEQLKATFGLSDEDINLNLGPLGRLL
jgi:hypothetical protein